MFGFIKDKISKVYNNFTKKAVSIFSKNSLDDEFLKELYSLLISSDAGVKTTNEIISILQDDIAKKDINTLDDAKKGLEQILTEKLQKNYSDNFFPKVTLLVGINGSGKTSFIAKFAKKLKCNNKKILVVAGDTFRAAAVGQLKELSDKVGVDIFVGKDGQDPASVIFDACKKFKEEDYDNIIIDTAGRLQTRVNLLKELEKINRVISKVLPDEKIVTWLTIDSMLGQNALQQAIVFDKTIKLDGIVLTKLDGTGKGGIVFSVTDELNLPILYVTYGEELEDIKKFDAKEYVKDLFE